jgi:hypothetical protein
MGDSLSSWYGMSDDADDFVGPQKHTASSMDDQKLARHPAGKRKRKEQTAPKRHGERYDKPTTTNEEGLIGAHSAQFRFLIYEHYGHLFLHIPIITHLRRHLLPSLSFYINLGFCRVIFFLFFLDMGVLFGHIGQGFKAQFYWFSFFFLGSSRTGWCLYVMAWSGECSCV